MYTSTAFLAVVLAVTAQQPAEQDLSSAVAVEMPDFIVSLIDDVKVSAREAGVLVSLDAREGQVVTKDEVLAHVDDSDAQIRMIIAGNELKVAEEQASSDASVKAADATIGVAREEYDDSKYMRRRSPNSVSEFEVRRLDLTHKRSVYQHENAQVEHRVDILTRDMRRAQLDAVQNEIDRRQVRAPIDGVVERRYRNPGEWVREGDPVYRVVRMDRLRVEGLVKADHFMPGDIENHSVKIEVQTPRGVETFQGTIDFVSHLVDSSNHFLVYAEFENPQRANGRWTVRPGLDAKLTILLAEPTASK